MIQITKQQAAEGFWLGCCSDSYIDPAFYGELKLATVTKSTSGDYFSDALETEICNIVSRMPSPVAVPVSGGVDSTLMLLIARKCFDANSIRPVTVFSKDSKGEYWAASELCRELGLRLDAVLVEPRQLSEVLAGVGRDSYRNWFANSSLVPTYFALKRGAEVGSSVLTGDGGDELFCGYDRWIAADLVERLPRVVRRTLLHLMPRPRTERRRKLLELLDRGYEGTLRVWTREEVELLLGKYPRDTMFETYRMNVSEMDAERLEKYALLEIATVLYGREVAKVETAARMAGDVPVVSPFLDPCVMKLCCGLPLRYKKRGRERKWLLRRMIERETCYRPGGKKRGFSVPMGRWFGNAPAVDHLVRKYVLGLQDPYLRQPFIDRVWEEHLNGYDNAERLWSVLMWRVLWERGVLKVEDT